MDLSRTFDELKKYKELINQREKEIKELEQELNNSKEDEKAILEEYKMTDTNKKNKIAILEMEIIEEKNKKFENKNEKENSKKEIQKKKDKIDEIKKDFKQYVEEDFEIKRDNLIEKWDEIKEKIEEVKENLENVKEVFEKYYKELMKYPEIKKMYDKAVADRAIEKANELANVNEIYSEIVSKYYKNIELRRGKISLEDKEKFDIELKNGIERKELKELTLEICTDILKKEKKDLTENEIALRENIEKEYKDVYIVTDEIRDEIFNKNESLIDDIRREALEEKVKLYEYKKYNQMVDNESKAKTKLYSKEEIEKAKKEELEAIRFAVEINDKKIDDYAEKMIQDELFMTGVLRYSKMNEGSDIKKYLDDKANREKNKKEIIKTILKDYEDKNVRTNMGKEEDRFRRVADKIYDKVKEKAKDKVDIQKNDEDIKKENTEENKNIENEKNKRDLPNTPRSAVKSSNEYMKTLTIDELRETQKEKTKKKGFIFGIKSWLADRKKQKEYEEKDKEDLEEKENLDDTIIINKDEEKTQEKEDQDKCKEEKDKELSKKDKEKLDKYEEMFRQIFREKIENDERIKEQTIENSKNVEKEEREK